MSRKHRTREPGLTRQGVRDLDALNRRPKLKRRVLAYKVCPKCDGRGGEGMPCPFCGNERMPFRYR